MAGIEFWRYISIINRLKITGGFMLTIQEETLLGLDTYVKKSWVTELSTLEVSGTGNIQIRNTGGSSAAEGGMGDGGGAEKGAGIKETGNTTKEKGDFETSNDKWDPVKPKDEKEKNND